ncbi:11233_t:CDS:2 [Paraglomus brasilianum]|uniref:11233_t:CDS:1 n=1 Tax=Paraglomus brasilianum TaxID=144538 RepID=A0A9N9EC08_9GLOM|nr:11233_t:CDS:2 [Paraglomus brasilianum]
MSGLLLFIGNFFKAVSEKPCEAVWAVSGDGSVWELDEPDSEECKKKDQKNDKKKGKKKNKKGRR